MIKWKTYFLIFVSDDNWNSWSENKYIYIYIDWKPWSKFRVFVFEWSLDRWVIRSNWYVNQCSFRCNMFDILLCQNMLKRYYKDDILNIINYRCLYQYMNEISHWFYIDSIKRFTYNVATVSQLCILPV